MAIVNSNKYGDLVSFVAPFSNNEKLVIVKSKVRDRYKDKHYTKNIIARD
jgi:hypothetical protein